MGKTHEFTLMTTNSFTPMTTKFIREYFPYRIKELASISFRRRRREQKIWYVHETITFLIGQKSGFSMKSFSRFRRRCLNPHQCKQDISLHSHWSDSSKVLACAAII